MSVYFQKIAQKNPSNFQKIAKKPLNFLFAKTNNFQFIGIDIFQFMFLNLIISNDDIAIVHANSKRQLPGN